MCQNKNPYLKCTAVQELRFLIIGIAPYTLYAANIHFRYVPDVKTQSENNTNQTSCHNNHNHKEDDWY